MKPRHCYPAGRFTSGGDEESRVGARWLVCEYHRRGIKHWPDRRNFIVRLSCGDGEVTFVLLHNPVLWRTQIFFSQHCLSRLQSSSLPLSLEYHFKLRMIRLSCFSCLPISQPQPGFGLKEKSPSLCTPTATLEQFKINHY